MVSICIPTYENTRQLSALLDSIGMQTYTDYEILLTDDSVSNQVQQLVEQHALGSKINYKRNIPSKGSPANWNYCISLATGDYIKIMHHDDLFSKTDSLQKFVAAIENKPDLDMVYSRCSVVHENGTHHVHSSNTASFNFLKKHPYYLFERNMIGPPSCTLYRRKDALSFDTQLKWLVDIDFYIRYLESKNCGFVNELLITTHTHEQSVTNALGDAYKLKEELDFLNRHYANISEVIRCRWLLKNKATLTKENTVGLCSPLRRKIRRMTDFSAIFAFYYKAINYRFWQSTERHFFEANA